jgi:conserved domain protein (fragment)
MATLPEESKFDDGVYQIELTDPVVGGPNGISNAPMRNLANRTRWLKDQVAELIKALQGKAPAEHVGAGGNAHAVATQSAAGFMSADDKAKLDGVTAGAQPNAVTTVAGRTGAVTLTASDVSGVVPAAGGTFSGRIYAALADFADPNETSVLTAAWMKKYGVRSVAGRIGAVTLTVSDVKGAAPSASPTFSGTIGIEAGTIVDFNHQNGAKVYVPAKKVWDITAPEAVSKYGLTDYAAPKVSPSIAGGMTVYGGTMVYGGATFSGTADVTAPRPANNDDSFKVATTSWVRQAMASIFEAAGFRVETRKSVTPGTFASPARPIQSSNGDCGMIALPSFLGGLKFVWVNCSVNRHTGWREVMWIRPMNEVFTGGASAFAVNENAVSIHPLPNCVRLNAFHRLDSVTDTESVSVYAWAIGR